MRRRMTGTLPSGESGAWEAALEVLLWPDTKAGDPAVVRDTIIFMGFILSFLRSPYGLMRFNGQVDGGMSWRGASPHMART